MDLTFEFNTALRHHNVGPLSRHEIDLDHVEAFLREAYRINKHIAELNRYLQSIRRPYLSAAPPPRRKQLSRTDSSTSVSKSDKDKDRVYLSDTQREQIDAETKQLLRELAGSVKGLADAERVRQSAEENVALRKRATKGLGAIGRWAAGGAITAKSPEEELEEAKRKEIKMHRESIIWYLGCKLEQCSGFQASMMEIRLEREREKSKSVLYKTRGSVMPPAALNAQNAATGSQQGSSSQTTGVPDSDGQAVEQELSDEQMQLFAEENQDMLKHYEDTLDKVRTTERSLLEISELQNTLATNLFEQAAQIDQLVQDSDLTAENVGSGNKELKRASERQSTAQMVFYATCVLCSTLVVWDYLI